MPDLIALAVALAAGQYGTVYKLAGAVDPYMWVAIPAVYAACIRAARITLERG